jgi:formylglycine-generating enzyme required for sulfatase activity
VKANGFTDLFVDHTDIAGGQKWEDALKASAWACRVVVCLVTENWLASSECFGEFKAAWYMGKRIVPLFRLARPGELLGDAKQRFDKVCAEFQGLDLARCIGPSGTLDIDADAKVAERLRTGLRAAGAIAKVGLDPQAFAIDTKVRETPFPGLSSFGDEDADAALFYGRGLEIARTLEELRQARAAHDLRPLVILGASGAGKSSLLKAGIIPRLRREAPAWLPLRAFRPGADPLLNFADALARTLLLDFRQLEAHGVIRDRLFDAWSRAERDADQAPTKAGRAVLEQALEIEGARLRAAAGRPAATILISVDQAEELARAEGASGDALADYLRVALASSVGNWQLAFTIRNDSFPELQSHRRFQDIEARGFDLRAIPAFRFDSVVEEPAKRYGVDIDPALVDALMEDAPKDDALPLLAFALQRLWHLYAASGALTRDHYIKVGGLRGLIEDAAERALEGVEPGLDVPRGTMPRSAESLGAATFVPALVQINDKGEPIRRIAEWESFDEDQRVLLARFDRWRLVVRKGEAQGGTVEVAHEALFREWSRLKGWLEPERARLDALRSLEVDAAAWERNGRDRNYLNHRDRRLADTEALTAFAGFRARITPVHTEYLADCREAENLAMRQRRRQQWSIRVVSAGAVLFLLLWLNKEFVAARWHWLTDTLPYQQTHIRPRVLTAERERALKPGDPIHECDQDCPEMVVVPAGRFTMGSPDGEAGRDDDEGPQHEVAVAALFAVSKFTVTFADWDACAAHGDCDPKISDSGFGRGRQPVINVTWDDAKRYAAWLSAMTGKDYRLLSEAEYEYAARARTVTAYPWGDHIGQKNANCAGCGGEWDKKSPAPVGSFPANDFGLHDMVGNVWSWVEDCAHTYDDRSRDAGAITTEGCGQRVLRGGSGDSDPRSLRSAARGWDPSDLRDNGIGFRLGRTLTP